MAAGFDVRIEGADTLRAGLGTARTRLRGATRRAAGDAARRVAATARAQAPRRSGRLASSIHAVTTARGAEIQAGTGLQYAGVIHYGWPRHGIEANPYLDRAVRRSGGAIRGAFEDELADTVKHLR